MSTTEITPLPFDLHDLGPEGLRDAISERKARAAELGDVIDAGGSVGVADVAELRRINDDIERLQKFASEPLPHPGHPGSRTGQRKDGTAYGRVEGLGAAFVKAVGGMKALDGTSGGATMPDAFFDPRIRELPQRQLFVRSLIPTISVTTDKVAYVRQTVLTNNAAAVATGAVKPTSVITAAREEAPIRVIAHVSEALDRTLLSDYDALTSFVDNQLRLGVLLEEERQILLGNGTPPNISGILDQTGLQTQAKGADPTPDAIFKAMTKIRLVFAEPDAVVLHPNDWQEIALLRNADGVYLWGDPADEQEPRIWGKRVVVTPVITEGTGLVGAFGAGAEVYQREGARISYAETGLSDVAGEELFTKNQIRARGESRLGLGVTHPNFFCSVTGI
jgi:HK97 family phage major capsid protein